MKSSLQDFIGTQQNPRPANVLIDRTLARQRRTAQLAQTLGGPFVCVDLHHFSPRLPFLPRLLEPPAPTQIPYSFPSQSCTSTVRPSLTRLPTLSQAISSSTTFQILSRAATLRSMATPSAVSSSSFPEAPPTSTSSSRRATETF